MAQTCKICNQIAIGGALAGVSEAFDLLARRVSTPRKCAKHCSAALPRAAYSKSTANACSKGQLRAWVPRAPLPERPSSRRKRRVPMASRFPATAVVAQLLNALATAGGADLDYSALGTVLFELAVWRSAPRPERSSWTGSSFADTLRNAVPCERACRTANNASTRRAACGSAVEQRRHSAVFDT